MAKRLKLKEDQFGNSDLNWEPDDLSDLENTKDSSQDKSLNSRESYVDTKWQKLYDKAKSTSEQERVMDNFLKSFLNFHNIPSSSLRKDVKDIIKDQFRNFGSESLDESKNPFLKFLVKYADQPQHDLGSMKASDYNNLINLYSKEAITDNTLEGKGQGGLDNPIFNSSMLGRTAPDTLYISQAYSWITRNLRKLQDYVKAAKIEDLTRFAEILGDESLRIYTINPGELDKDADQLKKDIMTNLINILFYQDSDLADNKTFRNTDIIRPANNIYKALDYLDGLRPAEDEKTSRDDLLSRADRDDHELSDADKKRFEDLDDEKARDLIAYLLKTHKGIKI